MKRTRIFRLLLAALCALVLCAPAQAAQVKKTGAKKVQQPAPAKATGVKVLEFGVYSSTVASREKSAAVADGNKDQARDFKLVRKSTLVDARLGTSIGLRYLLLGAPKGAPVLLEVAVQHPDIINPETNEVMTRSTATFERVIGESAHVVWSFDTQAGLVPGEYAIELLFEGKPLVRKVFRINIRK